MTFLFENLAFSFVQIVMPALAGIILLEFVAQHSTVSWIPRAAQALVAGVAALLLFSAVVHNPIFVRTLDDAYGEARLRGGEIRSLAPDVLSPEERLRRTREQVEAGEIPRD